MEKVNKKWKIIAIVFIILFILETILFGLLLKVGRDAMNNESECSINVCGDYDAYYFDSYENMCYCYQNNEVITQKYLN